MTETPEPKFLEPNPMSNINEALIRGYVADGNADALCTLFSSMRTWYQRAEAERDIFMRRMHEMGQVRGIVPRDISARVRETINTIAPVTSPRRAAPIGPKASSEKPKSEPKSRAVDLL